MDKIKRLKELGQKIKEKKATPAEIEEAKSLAAEVKKEAEKKGFKPRSKSRGSKGSKYPTKLTNDFSWYNHYPTLIKDSANIVFNEIVGLKSPMSVIASGISNNIEYPVVGAKFNILPTIGKSSQANNAFNYQMRDLWLSLHRAYRGVGTYEYADLGIVIFSIMMAFADIARAERIYGVASKFVAQNRSYPNSLLFALGLDPATISATRLADFRYQLNRCITKAAILCLPKGFSAFELYVRLFGSVFKDSENVRAQWYFYDSAFRLDYDPTFATGSSIVYSKRTLTGSGGSYQTLDDIITDINTQLDNLLSDTDVARMCSDILKAFGENGVQTLELVPETFELAIGTDDVRLTQLHNTIFCGAVAGGNFSAAIMSALGSFTSTEETLRIYQEGGVVKQELYPYMQSFLNVVAIAPTNYHINNSLNVPVPVANTLTAYPDGVIPLNTWKETVTEEDVVEITRQAVGFNHISFTESGNSYTTCEIDNYGPYIVQNFTLYNAEPNVYIAGQQGSNILQYSNMTVASLMIGLAGQLSRLDWAPRVELIYQSGGPQAHMQVWDLDNYTIINKEPLSRLHDACVLSVFKLEQTISGKE